MATYEQQVDRLEQVMREEGVHPFLVCFLASAITDLRERVEALEQVAASKETPLRQENETGLAPPNPRSYSGTTKSREVIQARPLETQTEGWTEAVKAKETRGRLTYGRWDEAKETPPSSPATETPEDKSDGPSTSSGRSLSVKVVIPGESRITAMVTFHDCNSPLTPGLVQQFLREGHWTIGSPTTSELPSLSGLTPLSIQEVAAAGRSAGGSDSPASKSASVESSTPAQEQAATTSEASMFKGVGDGDNSVVTS